jgi:hypothetical protein
MQHLAYTCRSAFEALGQHEAVALRRENEAMRVELFNATMPTFTSVVQSFNDARGGPQCTCHNCQHMGLIHHNWHDDWHGPCTLWPAWEALLERVQVRCDPQLDADQGVPMPWWDSHTLEKSCPEVSAHVRLALFFSASMHDPDTGRAYCTHNWEDEGRARSGAAVTQWRGRWVQSMHVVGAWGSPARSWADPRIAEWARIMEAVRELHFPERVAPTLGEFVPDIALPAQG